MEKYYNELDADGRFAKTINRLRSIRPFYSAVYESLEKEESESIDTMGVTCKKLIYNKKFVENTSFEVLLFVQLHEIAHVALMHVARIQGREPSIWNIAADLYVNALLVKEFKLTPGKISNLHNIEMPVESLYCSSIDIDNDYVELIYDKLIEQVNNQRKNTINNDKNNQIYEISYVGSSQDYPDKYSEFKATIKLNDYNCDIIDDGRDSCQKENDNKQLLAEAITRHDMTNKSIGNNPSSLEIAVRNILKSHVNWKKLLKKYCRSIVSSDSSFLNPDKRMYYQKAIYPGQSKCESNAIKGIKVCFDVSGSISDTDIAYFYGQVRDILKQFKLDAEIIYWDTQIESSMKLKTLKELTNVKVNGRGGTSPDCIFKYFDSKKCKVKPIVTLVFTDGYFFDCLKGKQWNKKYKDTIWVMTKDFNRDFKPKFGKLTLAKFAD